MEKQDLVLIEEAGKLAQQYQIYDVKDNASLVAADQDLTAIKKQRTSIEEARLKISRKLTETADAVMKPYKDAILVLDKVRANINSEISTYKTEQEKIRQEQEAKLREIARKEEEKQRKALEARAQKAAEKGNAEKAAELAEKAKEVHVAAPVVLSEVAETKNKPRQVWKYRITAINEVPREYMIANDTMLGSVARATKGILLIPGVEFYSEDSKF